MTSPDEIRNRRFLVALRGYDRDEVTSYLEEVADTLASMRSQVEGLEAQLERARAASQSGDVDTTVAIQALGEETTRILVTARESAQTIEAAAAEAARATEEDADRRAREIVDRANSQAARTIAEAERRRDAVALEIQTLEEHRDAFVANLGNAMTTLTSTVGQLGPGAAPADAAEASDVEAADGEPPPDGTASEPTGDEVPAEGDLVDAHPESEAAVESDPVEAEAAGAVAGEGDSAAHEDDTAAGDTAAGDPAAGDPAANEATALAIDSVESRRDEAIGRVRDGMARTCKRGLQDVQNEVMAAIRDHGRGAELDHLLPDPSELETLGDRGIEGLSAVYADALMDAAIEVDGEPPQDLAGGARVNAAVATFRAVLAHEVTSSLRATLRAGLEAGEPEPQLSERVGEVFRDLRGPVLDALVDEHLHRTYAHGLLDAWEQLGVEEVRWRPSEEARCPENQCQSNASEGRVPVGADFPSGDRVPPAHPGCTCAIVPVT